MATNTYVALDKVTLGSNTASITFSSINQGYTDLVIVFEGSQTGNGDSRIQYNSDTGSNTNYSETVLRGNGSTTPSARSSNAAWSYLAYTDASIGRTNIIAHIPNYSSTSINKTVLSRFNTAGSTVGLVVGLWRSTAAITSITISTSVYAYASGSTFSLYGIKAEGASGTKATGGAIYSDSTYFYHVFGSTGTFTPTQSLTADVLVVAGGGGASMGGGGAGGLLYFSNQSLSATGYTCTVGAGGTGQRGEVAQGGDGVSSVFQTLTATTGGGGGGDRTSTGTRSGRSGGSGGGAGYYYGAGAGGAGTSGQGYAGANSPGDNYAGGGGGAGAVGTGTTTNASGGNGLSTYSSWGTATGTGQNVSGTYWYAGGGGGYTVTTANGGNGGGGGGRDSGTPNAGTANTGGGGGGNLGATGAPGGNGGSGIIIVRYAK